MSVIQPYLPWALGLVVLFLLHLGFRRWSVRYSDKVIKELEAQIEQPTSATLPPVKPDTSPLGIRKKLIWDHVETLPADASRRIESLVADLASVSLGRDLERIYGEIFRSQVTLLRSLNLVTGFVERSEAEKWFAELGAENPELKKIEFGLWLQFLATQGLVVADEGKVGITSIGQEFLLWMIREKKPEKPYERS